MDERGNWCEVCNENPLETNEENIQQFEPVCYLNIGEIVDIKGEKFKVRKITKKDVILRSVR